MPPALALCRKSIEQDGCEMSAGSRPPDLSSVNARKRTHAVFVSYSEAAEEEEEFVLRLCGDLERAELLPIVGGFRSLWRGEGRESRATKEEECEVAIVVVSEEYFTQSERVMAELVDLVELRECEILLLFWGLSCTEFGDTKRRERWFRVWESWREESDVRTIDVWKDALKELDGRRGLEFAKAVGEVEYRKEIVTVVCSRLQWKRSRDEDVDVEKAIIYPGAQGLQHREGGSRLRGWCYYFCLVLLTPVIIISIICVGSVLYAVFFCDQGYPFPYGIIFSTMG